MPAIMPKRAYDDYEYIAKSRGSANAEPRRAVSKTPKRVPKSEINIKNASEHRNANRESIRNVMRENVSKTRNTQTATRMNKNVKPKEISLKKAELMKSPKMKANAMKKQNISRLILFIMCTFSALLLVCYRSSVINESFRDVTALKKAISVAETKNAQIESDIQVATDISSIESYAKYQLGMQKPEPSQIRKIMIQKEDKISTPVVIEEEESSFWDNLVDDILNILD